MGFSLSDHVLRNHHGRDDEDKDALPKKAGDLDPSAMSDLLSHVIDEWDTLNGQVAGLKSDLLDETVEAIESGDMSFVSDALLPLQALLEKAQSSPSDANAVDSDDSSPQSEVPDTAPSPFSMQSEDDGGSTLLAVEIAPSSSGRNDPVAAAETPPTDESQIAAPAAESRSAEAQPTSREASPEAPPAKTAASESVTESAPEPSAPSKTRATSVKVSKKRKAASGKKRRGNKSGERERLAAKQESVAQAKKSKRRAVATSGKSQEGEIDQKLAEVLNLLKTHLSQQEERSEERIDEKITTKIASEVAGEVRKAVLAEIKKEHSTAPKRVKKEGSSARKILGLVPRKSAEKGPVPFDDIAGFIDQITKPKDE